MNDPSEEPFPIIPSDTRNLLSRMDRNMDLVERLLGEGNRASCEKTGLVQANFINSIGMEMIWCPPGTFMMGSPDDEEDREDNETLHEVTLTQGFWIAATPVTQAQYASVTGTNPSEFTTSDPCPDAPVERVLWDDAVAWCRKISELDQTYEYRLPTDAQWEYACRAGTTGRYNLDGAGLADLGWFEGNSGERTHPVRRKRPNTWGLFDCHGNVWEWCADWYHADLGSQPALDPKARLHGDSRVLRGGSWYETAQRSRSADRNWLKPGTRNINVGFRPVRVQKVADAVLKAVAQPEP